MVVAAASYLHNVTLDEDRILQTRMYSLGAASRAYFIFVKLARLKIELEITGR